MLAPQSQLAELSNLSKNGVKGALRELEAELVLTIEQEASGRGATRYRLISSELEPFDVALARDGHEEPPDDLR